MAEQRWQTKRLSVTSLHLDAKNPRLSREASGSTPREIIEYLFRHDKAMEVAESIALRGFFPNEPLLAIVEDDRYVVIEGNRRLAALKALLNPDLLEGALGRQLKQLSKEIDDIDEISRVPVVVAPSRHATDALIAGRHIGTPVLSWQAENRARFILDKLEEGYGTSELEDELGFSAGDIQKARQTRAIAEMARALDLPNEVKEKLRNPRTQIFSTIERIFESSVGRSRLGVKPDSEHGFIGTVDTKDFIRAFGRIVTDIALGKQSSRTLNTNDEISKYFDSWDEDLKPAKTGSFVPDDVIASGTNVTSEPEERGESNPEGGAKPESKDRSKQIFTTVLPKSLKVKHGSARIIDIRRELTTLNRGKYPNAGAVLLRVFFELSVIHYLQRTGRLQKLTAELRKKNLLRYDIPEMRHLVSEIIEVAKEKLSRAEAEAVQKALKQDPAAPFTVSDMHAFVHRPSDLPTERDILQFWIRTEPLFRLMLESDSEGD